MTVLNLEFFNQSNTFVTSSAKSLPYGGTTSVLLDQLFSQVETAQGATKMFIVDAHERQIS